MLSTLSEPLNTSSRKAHSTPARRPSRLRSQRSFFRAESFTGPKYSSSVPNFVTSVWNFLASRNEARKPKKSALFAVPGGPTSSAWLPDKAARIMHAIASSRSRKTAHRAS